jgi:hypothetical protein
MQNSTPSAKGEHGIKRVLLGIVLFVVLIGLVGLIVYELKGAGKFPRAAKKSVTESHDTVIGRIDKTLNDLKEQTDRPPLNVAETLSNRPAVAPEAVEVEPARPVAQEPAAVREPAEEKPVRPELKGIFWNEKNPLVELNGAIVGINEEVSGYRVIEIGRDRVTVEDKNGNRQTVLLYSE